MIGRGDGQCFGVETVQQLEEGAHDSLQLAVFIERGPLLADRVEFIEEEHHRARTGELEDLPQVGRGFAQVGGDHGVETHRRERQVEFAGEGLASDRLAASRRPAEEHLPCRWYPEGAEQVRAASLKHDPVEQPTDARREDQVTEFSFRLGKLDQEGVSLLVAGEVAVPGDQRGQEILPGGRNPVGLDQDVLEVIGQDVVIEPTLLLDVLPCRRAKGGLVALEVALSNFRMASADVFMTFIVLIDQTPRGRGPRPRFPSIVSGSSWPHSIPAVVRPRARDWGRLPGFYPFVHHKSRNPSRPTFQEQSWLVSLISPFSRTGKQGILRKQPSFVKFLCRDVHFFNGSTTCRVGMKVSLPGSAARPSTSSLAPAGAKRPIASRNDRCEETQVVRGLRIAKRRPGGDLYHQSC